MVTRNVKILLTLSLRFGIFGSVMTRRFESSNPNIVYQGCCRVFLYKADFDLEGFPCFQSEVCNRDLCGIVIGFKAEAKLGRLHAIDIVY